MRRTLLSLLVLLMCSPVCMAAVEPKPKVKVTFVIAAAEIRGDLGAGLPAVVASVQTAVKSVLDARFPFFDWVTTGSAAHTLTLTLKERQGSLDIEHVLAYTGSVRSGSVPAPVHVLYPWDDPPPDPRELTASLVARVQADVAKSEAKLKAYFVSQLPLVNRVDIENRFVLLPVAGVHAESARFLVEFSGGKMELQDPLEAPDKGVYCAISNFFFPPQINGPWHDDIPTVMERAQNVKVKVKEFTPKAHENTSGGSVTALPGGGSR
ncbi:MAG TPA: hypothetical protein VHL59_15170 [Thermoanaerobaculia bacterium]|nr:hypothetical protein [Thermoanaerobaculia bacterium]